MMASLKEWALAFVKRALGVWGTTTLGVFGLDGIAPHIEWVDFVQLDFRQAAMAGISAVLVREVLPALSKIFGKLSATKVPDFPEFE